ncbi:MAG: cobalamin biosynthesis protein CobQ, partial [Candidatus Zixiibacteriota bacterium]
MVKTDRHFTPPIFNKRVLVVVGGYGSGKSEVSVNLARHLASSGQLHVAIADLDIVNPYFRSREATEQLEKLGIETLHPKGSQAFADLPIIIPQVKSAIEGYDGVLILDVGGDDAGARVLGSLAGTFPSDDHEVLFVLNANR